MKQNYSQENFITKRSVFWSLLICLFFILNSNAQDLRRTISPNQPMWLIHIDSWNYADPQKIIDLIPTDIKPYVVFNISLSISSNSTTGAFNRVEYGFETAESWLRTCAENKVWAMIQPASGGKCHFSDTDLSVYEYFYKTYPNLIGFNYAEQFWGYDTAFTGSWLERMAHFTNLLELSAKYGAYLSVSWCGYWAAGNNPIAMMKRNPDFTAMCQQYSKNFILAEKYTTASMYMDMESIALGTYLSGYSGNYGIRFDEGGWADANGNDDIDFKTSAGAIPHIEHIMLTGETYIDGPELIWTQCFKNLSNTTDSNGFSVRQWSKFPQFDNISVDIFRKIIDGTIRIPSRQEVIDRTKLVLINDVSSGTDYDKYSSPVDLFEGLYRMDNDGNHNSNKSWLKKTGRYPTIPIVYDLLDGMAQAFSVQVNKSNYTARWPSISSKITEFNNLFPQEYTGDIYAGRHENGWVTYNPFKTGQTANGSIPFKYNTCDHMDLTYSIYTCGVIKEISNKLNIYLTNFDADASATNKTDVIKIYGSSSQPTYSFTDRATNAGASVTSSWSSGVFTLTVSHNGPIDITVNCSGTATGRQTVYKTANIAAPTAPPTYTGPRQYEAENFDFKNTVRYVTNGYGLGVANYTALGYLEFGTNAAANVRENITVPLAGNYQLKTRYAVTGGNVTNVDLYVNGTKVTTPTFTQTSSLSNWALNTQSVSLNAGSNTIEYRANATGTNSLYFDNIIVASGGTNEIWLETECGTVGSLWDIVTDNTASGNSYIKIKDGNNSSSGAPTSSTGYVTYDFNITSAGMYNLWARIKAANSNDDSFWIKIDSGSWFNWNGFTNSSNWNWDDVQAYYLSTGNHTLTVAYREDGAQMDKIYIGNSTPNEYGETALNCSSLDNIWLEAECGNTGVLWDVNSSSTASTGTYIRIKDGNNSETTAPTDSAGYVTYPFNVTTAGSYMLWARIRAISSNDDSFWIKMDNGSWISWNGLTASTDWIWDDMQAFTLSAGSHTLTVAYREDGTDMDKIYIGNNLPTSYGYSSNNCETLSTTIQENEAGFCNVDGTIDTNYSGYTGSGFANTNNAVGSGVDWSVNFMKSGTKTLTFRYASTSNRPAKLIINGTTVLSSISFPSTGSWSTWSTVSVNVSVSAGISSVRLEATGSEGLGNIDYIEVTGTNRSNCSSNQSKIATTKVLTTDSHNNDTETVKFEYYSFKGERLKSINDKSGFFIVKEIMSNGKVKTTKIWKPLGVEYYPR